MRAVLNRHILVYFIILQTGYVIFQLYFSPGERLCLIRIYVSLFAKAARELQAKFSFQMCLLLHCRHLTKQYSPIKNLRAALFCKIFFNGDQF